MAFIRGMKKVDCLSGPLQRITVTAHANKEDGNVAFVRKKEMEREEKTITGSESARHKR